MSSKRVSALIAPTFYPVHAAFKSDKYSEIMLAGGRGSGKSSFLSLEILMGLLRDKDANAIVYRKVAATLRESVFGQLCWAIDALGLNAYFKARVSPLEILYIPTGQRILFRGADDPLKSKSLKLAQGYFKYLWFEELAEFYGMDAIRTIKASVIRGGGKALTLYSYNPPASAQSWVNAESLVARADRLMHHSTYLEVPAQWLGDSFIADAEALKETNERAYRHMYLGEVTGTGGQVFDNVELRAIDKSELERVDRFYNGLDFGFASDPDAFTRWAYDSRARKLYAVSEFYGAHNNIDTLAERVRNMAGREVVRCDSADPRMINELTRRNVVAVGVKKGAGSRDHGYRWLCDLGQIVIDPARTPNIAREFSQYEYAQDKAGNYLSAYPDANDHSIDSTRYALEPEISKREIRVMPKIALGI